MLLLFFFSFECQILLRSHSKTKKISNFAHCDNGEGFCNLLRINLLRKHFLSLVMACYNHLYFIKYMFI